MIKMPHAPSSLRARCDDDDDGGGGDDRNDDGAEPKHVENKVETQQPKDCKIADPKSQRW